MVKLLISWLSAKGYYILQRNEYDLLLRDIVKINERIDQLNEHLDQISENVKARKDEATAVQIISEWLNGEGTQ